MQKLKNLIDKLGAENSFRIYLPLFRVYLAFHIVKKIYLNMGAISLIFKDEYSTEGRHIDEFAFLKSTFIFDIPVIIQLTLLFAILFGFGILKNFSALMLFICNVVVNDTFALYGNGGDNLLYFVLLYMAFANSYGYLSTSKYKESFYSNVMSNLAVYAILFHLCLVYFVSAMHKIHSDVWFRGVATYYILNIERFSSPFNYLFCKNAFFIAASTYFTLIFETLFPVLIWFKSTKKIFMIAGILMHLGIYFFMMIYDFQILFIMIYGFFITNQQWEVLFNKYPKLKWMQVS